MNKKPQKPPVRIVRSSAKGVVVEMPATPIGKGAKK